jgi:DNA ligase (NAD+)
VKAFLDYASQRYYAGSPIISDDEFDKLAEAHSYEYVGSPVRDGVPHSFPMYSLKKCYVGEKPIELEGVKVETLKIDGAAVALTYVNGRFVLGLTRGDGKRGQDITDNIRHLVPGTIDRDGLIQVTGEVAAPKSIPNARNYAAGAMNLKDPAEVRTRNLTFIAYGIQPSINKTYMQDLGWLESQGFYDVHEYTYDAENNQLKEDFPTDGRVFRIDSNEVFASAGFTASHPRGAYALKERSEGVVTTLEDVVWQVGRTGAVSPVAILTPVMVGDARVSRATLHNMAYIRELGLELGCEVEIIRSGEIIPRVVRRV